ncbi:MAG: endonuclease III [Peptococcaceae bacterium]|nr:endonuclease III [Peptococcaceae bacterium]
MNKFEADAGRVREVLDRLAGMYPDARTALKYGSTFQLLVAVMLSAQCTDRQVNKITAELFKKYSRPEDFAALEWEDLAREIKGCGLYRNKSRNIVNASRILVEKYGSRVPASREALEALPGVGRKTANVVMNIAFNSPVMPVDTHVFRTSRRLGLSGGRTPAAVERDLLRVVPPDRLGQVHHCLILHGRKVCRARNPRCGECGLAGLCLHIKSSVVGRRTSEDI